MRVERRTIIGCVLSVALGGSLTFVACRGPRTSPTSGMGSAVASAPTPPAPRHTAAPGSSSAATPAPADTVAAAVAAAKACDAPQSSIVNRPDGGVVFVNAWHRKDAGNIDRLEGVVRTIVEQNKTFRCCFDVWALASAGAKGTLLLQLELEPDGAVKEASVAEDRSDVANEITRACVIEVAKRLSYPPSPSGVATLVEFPFVVEAP